MISVDVEVRRAVYGADGAVIGYRSERPVETVYWHRDPFRRLAHHLDTRHGWTWLRPFWKTWEVPPHG